MKKNTLLLCILLIISIILVGCGKSSTGVDVSDVPENGSSVTLSDEQYLLSAKSGLDKMVEYVKNKNDDGINAMIQDGEAMLAPKGTKLNVEDGNVDWVKVQMNDGTEWYAFPEELK